MGWINLEAFKKLASERPKNIYLQTALNQTAYQTSDFERQLKEDKLDKSI